MSSLDQVVFIVENDQIIESRIRELSGYIEETTTPRGVGPAYHIRERVKFIIDGEEFDSREEAEEFAADNEMSEEIVESASFELWTWGYCGSFPKRVDAFDTEEEAREALEETFYQDFWNSDKFIAFTSREEAEKFLNESAE